MKTSKAPKACIRAKVSAGNLMWIENHEHSGPSWIFAGILAQAGLSAIRQEEGPRSVGKTSNHYLWRCINREAEHYCDEVSVALTNADRLEIEEDAKSMGREMEDWLGSLIEIGVEIFVRQKGDKLSHLVEWRAVSLLGKEIEQDLLKSVVAGREVSAEA